MAFGLAIGTERAAALQTSIQNELTRRGLSADDAVMAEYITIMIINNKTSAQITAELNDLIGPEYESSFTDWLFEEAARTAPQEAPAPAQAAPAAVPEQRADVRSQLPAAPAGQRDGRAPRNGVYQQALSAALPSSSQKRTASARSPSPGHPNKMRRMDLPTGPRAMRSNDNVPNGAPPHHRSLLERMGPRQEGFPNPEMQQAMAGMSPEMMMAAANGGFPPGMDMMNMGANPMMLQEMMMNQMALMAQMASSMGIINPATGHFGGNQGFPPNGDMGGFQGNGNFQQNGRGRGGMRGRGGGRGGRGGHNNGPRTSEPPQTNGAPPAAPPAIAAPQPKPASVAPTPAPSSATPQRPGFVAPERPQSPTLCKFGIKCTNALCRYSHPSPVATPESGVVLSNEACENGKNCKDQDCTKAHVSPAVLRPQAEQSAPHHQHQHHAPPTPNQIPCKFGVACTRPGCTFYHPRPPASNNFTQQCRYGAGCTRATCPFQHPKGRVLPNSFHYGLETAGPTVTIKNPETGATILTTGASPHRSVTFNNAAGMQGQLEQRMKELEAKKQELKELEAKKEDATPVAATS
ncbi:hypothetical protein K525DRAFT_257154 [Schizophyllum commune Loenen D]|nr:hypothetical protein K525DRAFT_257154 [Schizophyllum commune Loenen D]